MSLQCLFWILVQIKDIEKKTTNNAHLWYNFAVEFKQLVILIKFQDICLQSIDELKVLLLLMKEIGAP